MLGMMSSTGVVWERKPYEAGRGETECVAASGVPTRACAVTRPLALGSPWKEVSTRNSRPSASVRGGITAAILSAQPEVVPRAYLLWSTHLCASHQPVTANPTRMVATAASPSVLVTTPSAEIVAITATATPSVRKEGR